MHYILVHMIHFEPIKKNCIQMPRYTLRIVRPRQTEVDDLCTGAATLTSDSCSAIAVNA